MLDKRRKICYRGRIDDQFGLRPAPVRQAQVEQRDLAEPIKEIWPVNKSAIRWPRRSAALSGASTTVAHHGDITYTNKSRGS